MTRETAELIARDLVLSWRNAHKDMTHVIAGMDLMTLIKNALIEAAGTMPSAEEILKAAIQYQHEIKDVQCPNVSYDFEVGARWALEKMEDK